MPSVTQFFGRFTRRLLSALLVSVVVMGFIIAPSAHADNTSDSGIHVAADGTDLTKVAQCLPKQLSQPSLTRALKESGNDFLERVLLNFKGSYDNYKLSSAETSFRDCLKQEDVAKEANA
ncbi:MAG: hypothetical protein AAF289_13635 [Cyanobacteria bacterium P01_A01_bin.135]